MANNSFSGRVLFSPDATSQEPYPARYPIYVSPATTSMNLTTSVSGGLAGGSVKWVQDGAVSASDPVTAASYQGTKSVSLASLPTYVRTEIRDSKNAALAMSEPIFFMGVTGLPAQMSYHVAGVTTPTASITTTSLSRHRGVELGRDRKHALVDPRQPTWGTGLGTVRLNGRVDADRRHRERGEDQGGRLARSLRRQWSDFLLLRLQLGSALPP